MKPHERWADILRQMEALNLHGGGVHSNVLRAFGVNISPDPLRMQGFRRAAPAIQYKGGRALPDNRMANWKSSNNAYYSGGRVDLWVVAYDGQHRDKAVIE